jgi:hypothetical protein
MSFIYGLFFGVLDQDPNGGYERGKFSTDGFITSKATVCSNTAPVPTAEFHFLLLPGIFQIFQ